MESLSLRDKIAVIAGGGSGIGVLSRKRIEAVQAAARW